MDKPFVLTILLLGLLSFISCSPGQTKKAADNATVNNPAEGTFQDQQQPPLILKQVLTIGNNEDLILPSTFRIQGPVGGPAGNIYFIDNQKGRMYSFTANGALRWETGNKGKGPGDFENPRGLVTDGKYLYTANVQGTRIDQFDFEGRLVNSASLEKFDLVFASVTGFIGDSLLVTTSVLWENIGQKVTVFNTTDSLKKISEFEVHSTKNIEVMQGFAGDVDIKVMDTLITAGNVADYELRFYTIKGKMVKAIRRDFNKLMSPGFYQSGSSATMKTYGSLHAPISLKNGYFISVLNWPVNVDDPNQFLRRSRESKDKGSQVIFKNAMDLYDADGTLLYTQEADGLTPGIGTITYVDDEGNIYTKSDTPFPQLRKYTLSYAPYLKDS